MIARIHNDLLYGEIPLTELEVRLIGSPCIRRQAGRFLALPAGILPASVTATRLHHAIGAFHLARKLITLPGFRKLKGIPIAALAHDAGHPPASHGGEPILEELRLTTHEEESVSALEGDPVFRSCALEYGADLEKVKLWIEGKGGEIAKVICGYPDCDNIDNIIRYLIEMGKRTWLKGIEMIEGFVLHKGKVCFRKSHEEMIVELNRCRRVIYDFIESDTHRSPENMVRRAMHFARTRGEITETFLRWSDMTTIEYLIERCNPYTQKLMERLLSGQHYEAAFSTRSIRKPRRTPKELANAVTDEFRLPPADLCTAVQRNTGDKAVAIPLIDSNGVLSQFPTNPMPSWHVGVYVSRSHQALKPKIQAWMQERVSDL